MIGSVAISIALLVGGSGVQAPEPASDLVATVDLYGSVSGFAKARTDRVSITVGPIPESAEVDLGIVLGEWNRAAGWNLFGFAESDETADVTFRSIAAETCPNYGACVGWDQFDSGWYKHCYVMLWPWKTDPNVVLHELGHCLGFVDVETTYDTDYRGIMSYARDRTLLTLGEQDIASLVAVGYRDAETA